MGDSVTYSKCKKLIASLCMELRGQDAGHAEQKNN